jgi:hypothetical protein
MIPFRANRLTVIALVVFFLAIIGYAYFEARNVIRGPSIALAATTENITVHESLVLVRGTATNINELRMNGRIIPTTEAGAFEEAHLLAAGYNKIVLSATDKIGRSATKTLELVYEPEASPMTSDDLQN